MTSARTFDISSSSADHLALATNPVRFSRILVGVDFTEPSLWALRLAIQLAEIYDSEVFLVHAVTPFSRELTSSKDLRSALDQAREEMNWLAVNDTRLRMVPHTTTVAYAAAEKLIEQVAQVENADLIVVGSHRLSQLERATLGSVSEAVLRTSKCPVLVVGPACTHNGNPLESVVLATDLKTTGIDTVRYAASLAEHGDGKLALLHVIRNRNGRPNQTDQEAAEEKLHRLLPDELRLARTSRFRAECGDPADVIPAVLELESATLLVVGLRDYSSPREVGSWTFLKSLIRESICPILTVRNTAAGC